jgi:hypothetical protein
MKKALVLICAFLFILNISACKKTNNPSSQISSSKISGSSKVASGETTSSKPASSGTGTSSQAASSNAASTSTGTSSKSSSGTVTPTPTQAAGTTPTHGAGATPTLTPTTGASATPTTAPVGMHVADIYTFGSYEQDNNSSNGKEGIQWRICEIDGDKALLVSTKGLDMQKFSIIGSDPVIWENSGLRTWLNGTFYNAAFSAAEKTRIVASTQQNLKNPDYAGTNNPDTTNKIFIFSYDEAQLYYDYYGDRDLPATAYAQTQGATVFSGKCFWWVRTQGGNVNTAIYVDETGHFDTVGAQVDNSGYAIVPSVWIYTE